MGVYKKQQFKAFLKAIKQGHRGHWQQIAEAIGVDKNTITAWKEEPEAQEAIAEGIEHAMEQMEMSGKRDWRMWETKLKMLGINPPVKHEGNIGVDLASEILNKYGLKGEPDGGQTDPTVKGSRKNSA